MREHRLTRFIRPRCFVLLALLALALPLVSQADDLSFTYLELTARHVDPDFASSEIGYRGVASLGLPLNFYGFAQFETADLDNVGGDLNNSDFGLGWHIGLGDTVQGLVEAAWTNREAGLFDEDGYTVNVGVRVAPGDTFEFGAKAGYRNLDNNLDGGFGEAYLLWKLWGPVGLVANAELAEKANYYGLGVRLSF